MGGTSNRTWFFVFVLSFTLGILFRSFVNLGFEFLFFLIFIAFALFPLYFVYRTRGIFLVSLFIFGLSLGIFRFDVSEINKYSPILESQIEKTVLIEGIILREPDERDINTILIIEGDKIKLFDKEEKINNKIRLSVDRYPSFKYGDRVVVSGKIVHPKSFENEITKKIFDYPGYLSAQGIYYEIK